MPDTFQWERCDSMGASCADIVGETGATYTLVADDVDQTIRARGTRDGTLVGTSDYLGPVVVSSGYVEPFPTTAAHRQAIPEDAAIHPNTALMISAANFWLLDGVTRPSDGLLLTPYKTWLGPRPHAYYCKGPFSDISSVTMFRNYTDGVGYVCGVSGFDFPVPSYFDTELGLSNGSMESSDAQLYVCDSLTGDIFQTYRTTAPGKGSRDISCSSSRWNSVRADLGGDLVGAEGATNTLFYGCTAAFGPSASQIVLGAGMLRTHDFDDLTPGSYMGHALRITSGSGSDGTNHPAFVHPARSGDGQQPYGIPAGARVQLDPAIDVTTWPSILAIPEPAQGAIMKIARTLQVYGLIQCDTTGAGAGFLESEDYLAARNSPDSPSAGYEFPWEQVGWPSYSTFPSGWGLQNGLPYDLMSHFRVIDWNFWTGA